MPAASDSLTTRALPSGLAVWTGFYLIFKPVYEPSCAGDPGARGAFLVYLLDPRTGLDFGTRVNVAEARNYDPNNDGAYKFYWGYRPETDVQRGVEGFNTRFDIRIGMYRNISDPGYYSAYWMGSAKLSNDDACMPGTRRSCP